MLVNIEKQSEHPLADAVVKHFEQSEPPENEIDISAFNFESITGKGAKASLGGETYFAGNRKLLNENNIEISQNLITKEKIWGSESKSVIWFADSRNALAVIAIADKIKDTSIEAVGRLQKMGIDVYMLTGDNETTARFIAAQAGISHFEAEVLPEQKVDFIKRLQEGGKTVAMVGDGINDSAALAQADVSIAMGKGSDIAMDVAKMTIISSDLNKIPTAINLSKKTVTTIKQNLF